MPIYRITKFNPAKRNAQGYYTDPAEWTSISCIEQPEYRSPTYQEYETVENAYVHAVRLAMQDNGIHALEIEGLELRGNEQSFAGPDKNLRLRNIQADDQKDIQSLHDGLWLSGPDLDRMIRLILRECLWMRLLNGAFEVKFGYDYYMYIDAEQLSAQSIRRIESSGLFVEPGQGQRDIIVVGPDGTIY